MAPKREVTAANVTKPTGENMQSTITRRSIFYIFDGMNIDVLRDEERNILVTIKDGNVSRTRSQSERMEA
jgi:hypothetical protein